jgi:hypothetical protein
MPEIVKKEPGRPDVENRERGDPRQHYQPIEKHEQEQTETAQDQPPANRRSDDSPWMGGG